LGEETQKELKNYFQKSESMELVKKMNEIFNKN